MITGMHAMMYSPNAEAIRTFLKDVLEFSHIDAGGGWLIFKAPPTELAAHPTESATSHWELALMCDDIEKTLADLSKKHVPCGTIEDKGWGLASHITLPDGCELMIYQPRYQTAI